MPAAKGGVKKTPATQTSGQKTPKAKTVRKSSPRKPAKKIAAVRTEEPELSTKAQIARWLRDRRVTEVECMVPDMSGIARGKILPTGKFLSAVDSDTLRIPESVFGQTVTGDYIDESDFLSDTEPDVILEADGATLRMVPWYEEPTAQVICDAVNRDGSPVKISPRAVLQNILKLYEDKGWQPVVAPELEFFLASKNIDPDYPLEPPIGRSGRRETGRQSYGIDAVNEFDPIFEDMYDFCEVQDLDVDTLIHEAGAAQVEINFNHGNALELADQVFLFKRTVRQAALRHGVYATFMAKPYQNEPGSSMHIHQSIVDKETGKNLFASRNGRDTKLFHNHIGGLQKHLPTAMALIAPNVNSYRRIVKWNAAPINTHWAVENRTVGLRVPISEPSARRIENRVAGADTNPYLAFAASLACGYLGMVNELKPSKPKEGVAYESKSYALPKHLLDALNKLNANRELRETLGEDFITVYTEVKMVEYDAYQQVISAWEREHLLLNV
ncbi:MAG: glutamine synthetase [Alphaproteobacteria bacterium]|nr:glutamine synthetase [Rhodobiaceae bacterium]MBO6543094.1 glutamine synthetase [Alphaproteobacteria bacterium]MBO6626979.1 glutamine synthetase [Alphaproteobacteria bacterium]MDF1627925.1 glutamine synthetase family protein [Parvibaculaceae bacterium]